jgi:MFS family permease
MSTISKPLVEPTLSFSRADVRRATVIAFLAWVFAVYDFILFGTLLPEIGNRYNWDSATQSALATWVAVGTAVVAFIVGPLVDRVGRRAGIIITISGAAFCSILTSIGGGLGKAALVLIRSVSGMGYAEQTVNATYLSEVYSAANDPVLERNRGFIYSLVQGGWPVGALVAAGLTAFLLPVIGWQGCFIFAAIPSLVIAFLARKLRETPQFIQSREAALSQGQGGAAERQGSGLRSEKETSAGLAMAFRGEALRATLFLGLAFFLNWFAIQVFSVLGTTVITAVHKITFENSLLILVLSNVVGYLGYLAHGYVGDRIGRRNAIPIGWMLGGIAFAAMLLAGHDFGIVVLLYSVGLFFLIGPYAALLFFIGESYPTVIRATGGGIINALGPVGAIVAGIGATSILQQGGNWQTAALVFGALPCFVSGILVLGAKHIPPQQRI